MLIACLHKILTASSAKTTRSHTVFWFSLSLTFAVIYGILAWQQAFSSEYVVQEDARVYMFWLQRFVDPSLLPHDLIADYYQSVTPSGYAAFYQFVARLGIEPLLLSKLLPMFLGVVTTAYAFGVCLQIFPVPAAAFTSTLLMNQSLWLKDDLATATPRAFIYPLFLAFSYYLLRRSVLATISTIALLGLFYPLMMFVSVGILIVRLWRWDKGKLGFSQNRSDYISCAWGLAVAGVVMLSYAFNSSAVGATVTGAEARFWPEFSRQGRIPFFDDNFFKFWFQGNHSGIRLSINPAFVGAGLLLPFLLRYPSRFSLAKQITDKIAVLPQIIVTSLGFFLAAHALLFKLYLPSRYTVHTLKIAIAIASGIALILIFDASVRSCRQEIAAKSKQQFLILGATILVGATLVFYPNLFWQGFPMTGYVVGRESELYKFFQQQPKDILIASLAEEANNIPTFSHRSVLVARKFADPYHVSYTLKLRQRASDLIRAQYAPNLAEVQSFIQKYQVNFWLVERTAFAPSYLNNRWFKQYQPAQAEASANLERSLIPALAKVTDRCSVFETNAFVVLSAKCIAKIPPEIPTLG